jgi:hypothetical protein
MKRPAIALKRIQSYDGEYVVFSYHDKTSGEEKTEKVTVEEFIARVIRHIPDENFKTIRYYGVYSRRLKKVSKTLVASWQKEVRKSIVRAQRRLKRRNWKHDFNSGWNPTSIPPQAQKYGFASKGPGHRPGFS